MPSKLQRDSNLEIHYLIPQYNGTPPSIAVYDQEQKRFLTVQELAEWVKQ